MSENKIIATSDGAVQLYHDNTKMVETSVDGVDMPDNKNLQLGDGDDLQLYHILLIIIF